MAAGMAAVVAEDQVAADLAVAGSVEVAAEAVGVEGSVAEGSEGEENVRARPEPAQRPSSSADGVRRR